MADYLNACSPSAHLPQLADAAGGDPFGDQDIAIGIETGVVWVDELAVLRKEIDKLWGIRNL